MCDDAFGDSGFDVSGMMSVNVSAVNCLGQRATAKVAARIKITFLKLFIVLQVVIGNHLP